MTKLQDLIDLAKEPSSEKRRVLLREVTDLFFANPDHRGGELTLFDDVLTQLAGEMEEAVRVELAVRLAPTPSPPFKLVRTLAADAAIAVAQPILEGSSALTDEGPGVMLSTGTADVTVLVAVLMNTTTGAIRLP